MLARDTHGVDRCQKQDGSTNRLRTLVQDDQDGQQLDPVDLPIVSFRASLVDFRVPILQTSHMPSLYTGRIKTAPRSNPGGPHGRLAASSAATAMCSATWHRLLGPCVGNSDTVLRAGSDMAVKTL